MRTIYKALWVLAVAALILQIYIAVAHPPIIAEYVKAALLGAMLSILLHDLPPVERGLKRLQGHTPSVILMVALILGAAVFYFSFPIYTMRVTTYSKIGQSDGAYNATIYILVVEEVRNHAGFYKVKNVTAIGAIPLIDTDAARLIQTVINLSGRDGGYIDLTNGTYHLTAPINLTKSYITFTGGTLVGNVTHAIHVPSNVTHVVISNITFNQTSTAISTSP